MEMGMGMGMGMEEVVIFRLTSISMSSAVKLHTDQQPCGVGITFSRSKVGQGNCSVFSDPDLSSSLLLLLLLLPHILAPVQ